MVHGAKTLNLFRALAVFLILVVVIRTAWLSDDALITLRTVLNITHGWGPGYNASEAVQAYTHPMWFLLWVAIGSLTNQWILGIFALSVVLVGVGVAVVAWRAQSLARLVIVTAVLLLSNAFIDFTTSGLENPLAFASLAILFALMVPESRNRLSIGLRFGLLGLTSAAVVLTRFDLAALIAIPIAMTVWDNRRTLRPLVIAAASLVIPVGIWMTWTWATYATLMPNTFAAKTNAQIPQSEFIVQGLRYLWVTFEHDPVTLIGLVVGLGVGLVFGPRMLRGWALGVVVYLAYVVWVGGDFMGGRFLAVPLFVAMLVLAASPMRLLESKEEGESFAPLAGAIATIALLVVGLQVSGIQSTALANPQSPRWEVDQNFNAGVADARGSSLTDQRDLKGLIDNLSLAFLAPDFVPIGDGTGLNRPLRDLDKTTKNWPTNDGSFSLPSEVGVFCGFLGTVGIVTGPTTHLIDDCALTDRFLAERPFVPAEPFAWKAGHFHREIPEGYVDAVAAGDASLIVDMADAFRLQQLWDKIR